MRKIWQYLRRISGRTWAILGIVAGAAVALLLGRRRDQKLGIPARPVPLEAKINQAIGAADRDAAERARLQAAIARADEDITAVTAESSKLSSAEIARSFNERPVGDWGGAATPRRKP